MCQDGKLNMCIETRQGTRRLCKQFYIVCSNNLTKATCRCCLLLPHNQTAHSPSYLPPAPGTGSTLGLSVSSVPSFNTEVSGSPSSPMRNSTGAPSADPRCPLSRRRRFRSTSCWRNLSMQSSTSVDGAFLCWTVTCNFIARFSCVESTASTNGNIWRVLFVPTLPQ